MTWSVVPDTVSTYIDMGDLSGYVEPGYVVTDYIFFSIWTVTGGTSGSWSVSASASSAWSVVPSTSNTWSAA